MEQTYFENNGSLAGHLTLRFDKVMFSHQKCDFSPHAAPSGERRLLFKMGGRLFFPPEQRHQEVWVRILFCTKPQLCWKEFNRWEMTQNNNVVQTPQVEEMKRIQMTTLAGAQTSALQQHS